VILIVCEALIDLRARQIRKAVGDEGVDRFAGLEETDHIVHPNPGAFDPGVSSLHPA
jgi:hypothetical protein